MTLQHPLDSIVKLGGSPEFQRLPAEVEDAQQLLVGVLAHKGQNALSQINEANSAVKQRRLLPSPGQKAPETLQMGLVAVELRGHAVGPVFWRQR